MYMLQHICSVDAPWRGRRNANFTRINKQAAEKNSNAMEEGQGWFNFYGMVALYSYERASIDAQTT